MSEKLEISDERQKDLDKMSSAFFKVLIVKTAGPAEAMFVLIDIMSKTLAAQTQQKPEQYKDAVSLIAESIVELATEYHRIYEETKTTN